MTINIQHKKSGAIGHVLFWLISISANAYIFKISSQISWLDFYYAAFSHICLITGAYINVFILIPIFFQHQKYLAFGLTSMLNILLMMSIYFSTFQWLADWVLPDFFFVSQFNELEVFIYALAYLSFTTLLNLSESWFELRERNKQMLLNEKENIYHQLNTLKSQINPHFLFNSLNLIYAEALKKTEHVPEIVLKLSDILRYVLYKSKNDTIKLSEEIELINNYIELQNYRTDDNCKISFNHTYDIDHHIAPMLFLPLIENSFKHGLKGDIENTYVNIKLKSSNQSTSFFIANNKGKNASKAINDESGIGLENVKRRLELLYPHRHSFNIKNENDSFTVEIILKH